MTPMQKKSGEFTNPEKNGKAADDRRRPAVAPPLGSAEGYNFRERTIEQLQAIRRQLTRADQIVARVLPPLSVAEQHRFRG